MVIKIPCKGSAFFAYMQTNAKKSVVSHKFYSIFTIVPRKSFRRVTDTSPKGPNVEQFTFLEEQVKVLASYFIPCVSYT